MVKTFFKYLKKRWWAFLLWIPVIWFSVGTFVATIMGIASDNLSDFVIIIVLFTWFLMFLISMSLPMLIITIPASHEIGLLRKKSKKKYLFIYQIIIFCILLVLLIIPFLLILFQK